MSLFNQLLAIILIAKDDNDYSIKATPDLKMKLPVGAFLAASEKEEHRSQFKYLVAIEHNALIHSFHSK